MNPSSDLMKKVSCQVFGSYAATLLNSSERKIAMKFFTWKEQFKVQIPEMDQQHQRFFQLMNQIHVYNNKQERDSGFLDGLFQELVSYIHIHFDEEEKLLEMTGYEGLAHQKKQHQFFRDQIALFHKQHLENNAAVPQSTLNFMRDWILNHILETDQQYGKYLANVR
jgi:hemerythrin-like metal-binding protein